MRIFISYAREDSEVAKRIYGDLMGAGYDPWLDSEQLVPGENWKLSIGKALRQSELVLALLSHRSLNKRGFVQREVKQALALLEEIPGDQIFVIPVRLEECVPSNVMLAELHWIDLFPDYESGCRRILRLLSSYGERSFDPASQSGSRRSTSLIDTFSATYLFPSQAARTLTGHRHLLGGKNRGVEATAFAPSGDILYTAGSDKTVKMWTLSTGKELKTVKGHRKCVNSVTISPGGELAVSCSDDHTLRWWSSSTGELIRETKLHNWQFDVAFSPNGEILASSGWDGLRFWHCETGKQIGSIEGELGHLTCLCFHPSDSIIAFGSGYEVKLWDFRSKKIVAELGGWNSLYVVRDLHFSPDGRILGAVAPLNGIPGTTGKIFCKLWDVSSGEESWSTDGYTSAQAVRFSPTGEVVAIGAMRIIDIWCLKTHERLQTLKGHKDDVSSLAFTPDGRFLASGSRDRTAILWE